MATYCPASGQIKLSQIKAAFGNTKSSLSQYRSLRWYKNPFAYGNFSAGTIKFSDFYSTGDTVTPTASSQTVVISGITYNYTRISSTTTATVGAFNIMSIAIYGGTGGQAGYNGNYGAAGSPGGQGGTTYLGAYGSSVGGAGGTGGNGTLGSAATVTQLAWSAAADAAKINSSLTITIGAGGTGGTGGANFTYIAPNFYPAGNNTNGNAGASGYVDIYWY